MDDLYKIKLCDLLKAEFDCACGKKHMINAEVRYGGEEDLKKVLSEIAPNGKTAFISLQSTFFTYGEGVLSAISAAGSAPLNIVLNRRFDNTLENIGGLFALPDDVRAVVVYDTELFGVAEYFTALRNIPLVMLPLSPEAENVLSPTVTVKLKNKPERIYAENRRYIIIDAEKLTKCADNSIAAAFAGLASGIIALIDYRMRGTVAGEWLCKESYNLVRSCITGALGILKVNKENIAVTLLEDRIRISAAEVYTDGEILSGSGESAVAELLEAGGKKSFTFAERKFYAAYKLIDLYKMFFTEPHANLLGVPDYIDRAEKLSLLTGIGEYEVLKSLKSRSMRAKEVDKKLAFVWQKFAGETEKLSEMKDKLLAVYVKLGGDASLTDNYDSNEIRRAIYHAPDLPGNFSVLTLMRDTGILELLK